MRVNLATKPPKDREKDRENALAAAMADEAANRRQQGQFLMPQTQYVMEEEYDPFTDPYNTTIFVGGLYTAITEHELGRSVDLQVGTWLGEISH